jgi:hypothetical protein
MPRRKKPKQPEPPTLPTVPDVRAVITQARVDGEHWRVRCDDGTMIDVEIGDVERQRENLPLMVVGATVEFDLVDGFIADGVEVVTECNDV